ncbi:MAG TPA: hexitol phosphatase HxpB [Thermoanaerobaculia bacterium]|nr:hexitol phosphatase HxpB [Thermoanaerobaculia bacterium]
MPRALIFDMDGVLIDSEPFWREAEMEGFLLAGVRLEEKDCLETVGLRIDEVVRLWYGRHPWSSPSPEEIERAILDRLVARVRERGTAKPGVREALAFARSAGLRVALASSSPYRVIEAVVETLGLAADLEVLVSAEGEEWGKPHPAVYLNAARRLGIAPEECAAVEDSPNGVLSAKAARMKCIAVPEDTLRGHPYFAIADRVIGSLAELDAGLWQEVWAAR